MHIHICIYIYIYMYIYIYIHIEREREGCMSSIALTKHFLREPGDVYTRSP